MTTMHSNRRKALPDDKEEAALDSSISREGSRFDQIIRK